MNTELMTVNLPQSWTLRVVGELNGVPASVRGRDVPATVPGCVHTDLLAAGLIPEPYLDRNELEIQWIGHADWRYACRFEAAADLLARDRVELVCEGLDTVATVELNGREIGRAANMHHAHRFDAKGALRVGANELVVTFASAIRHAEDVCDELDELPHAEKHPFNFIRKMACNFGWDWGPCLVTAGIWRPIYLQAWGAGRIASVRPLVREADARRAVVDVHVDLAPADRAAALELAVVLVGPDGEAARGRAAVEPGAAGATCTLEVSDPRLWWPTGHGGQPLYELTVSLEAAGAAGKLDAWRGRIGLRTVRLRTEPDEVGRRFVIEVNGKEVFCKGADWIPDDCFPTRVDEARYRRRLRQAVGANMNMLRIWGGGIYETDTFYDVCDETGLMVWQDFCCACACYPEEEPFGELFEAEARYNVTRLSRHASLVIWNGCNENIWGYFDWGWKDALGGRAWGLGYYTELFPRLVAELDPSRPYWPGSPYSGSLDVPPNLDTHGNKHIWEAWHGGDYVVYRDFTPRFASEFGFQGPPTWAAIVQAIPPDQRYGGSPAMDHHQRCAGGNQKIQTLLEAHFRSPEDFRDWLYVAQLNQARALRLGVEWFRSRQPVCMGLLYWQLNDCWPVTSWAAIDGLGRPKLLWYATRRFFADRLLTLQPEGDGLALFAVNDTDEPWTDTAAVRRLAFDGTCRAAADGPFTAGPRSCLRVQGLGDEVVRPADPARELIVADAGSARAAWFFERDKDLDYPEPDLTAELASTGQTHRLTVTAKTLLRDLAVLAEYADAGAAVSDQLVTLLPGESHTFEITSDRALTADELARRPVLQCANHYGRGGSRNT